MHIFADDTKVYRIVSSDNDRAKLQEDFNSLVKWSDTWQLRFNADKCKVLQLGHNNNQYTYDMAGVELQITPCEKDLGVYIDNKLKPPCCARRKQREQNAGPHQKHVLMPG